MFESKTTEPITNGEVPSQPETETVKQEGTWQKKKLQVYITFEVSKFILGSEDKTFCSYLIIGN